MTSLVVRSSEVDTEKRLLTAAWITAFQAVLQRVSGVEYLCDLQQEQIDVQSPTRTFVTVAYSDATSGSRQQLCTLDGVAEFEMLGAVDGTVAIVIPGVRLGWIPTEAVVSTRTQATLLP